MAGAPEDLLQTLEGLSLFCGGATDKAIRELEKIGVLQPGRLGIIGMPCSYEQAEEYNCEKPIFDNFSCVGCWKCIEECPEKALHMEEVHNDFEITVNLSLCNGIACRRCEKVCQEMVFNQKQLFTSEYATAPQEEIKRHGSN